MSTNSSALAAEKELDSVPLVGEPLR